MSLKHDHTYNASGGSTQVFLVTTHNRYQVHTQSVSVTKHRVLQASLLQVELIIFINRDYEWVHTFSFKERLLGADLYNHQTWPHSGRFKLPLINSLQTHFSGLSSLWHFFWCSREIVLLLIKAASLKYCAEGTNQDASSWHHNSFIGDPSEIQNPNIEISRLWFDLVGLWEIPDDATSFRPRRLSGILFIEILGALRFSRTRNCKIDIWGDFLWLPHGTLTAVVISK